MSKLEKVIKSLIDFPDHKLKYVIANKTLVEGLKANITMYGVQYTKEVHDTLVDIVNTRLSGSDEIEYEWSEDEYENFVKFKGE